MPNGPVIERIEFVVCEIALESLTSDPAIPVGKVRNDGLTCSTVGELVTPIAVY